MNDLFDDSNGEDVVLLVKDIYGYSYPNKKIEGHDIENVIAEHNENATGITKREDLLLRFGAIIKRYMRPNGIKARYR